MNGTQRRALVRRIHCMNSGAPKVTSQAEVMSNSKKINSVSLAIAELRLSEGISEAVNQSVENSI